MFLLVAIEFLKEKQMKKVGMLLLVALFFLCALATAEPYPDSTPLKAEKKALYHAEKALRGTGGQPSTTLDQYCPDGSLFDQSPTPVDGNWTHATSEQNPGWICQENFNSVSGIICDIHFWGLNLMYAGGWAACDPPENPMEFEIIFYQDVGGAPGAIVQVYNVILPGTPTGEMYADIYHMYAYDTVLDPCLDMIAGWVSIQGQGDVICWFLWTSHGETGEGYSLQNGTPTNYDLSLCLTGDPVDRYGACCDDATGVCNNNILLQDCPVGSRWEYNTLCDDLDPPCGGRLGACCDDAAGECADNTPQMACQPPLRWAEGTLCNDLDPFCGGCPEDEMTINIFTDDYPEETTWEVIDQATGLPIASGGPLANAQTLYTWIVCVDSDGCYDFIIYDAYGDGICCAYGYGYYEVYLNSVMVGSNYDWTTGMDMVVDIGGGCGLQIPTLSEWGMLIMGLLLLAVGTAAVVRRRKAAISKAV